MEMHTVYIALGSNIGNRLNSLRAAINNLPPQVEVKAKSPVYETEPWGYSEQDAFLNMVVKGETYLEARHLVKHFQRLEVALGRTPTFQNGPRVIDIDILFYDDLIVDTPLIQIPHPRVHERAFVLVPLHDIAPDLLHPVSGRSVGELLAACDRSGVQRYEK